MNKLRVNSINEPITKGETIMKLLKPCLLIAALSLTAVSSHANTVIRSKSNICNNIIVKCTSCSPVSSATQPAQADKSGHIQVQVSAAGTYQVIAADGDGKGKVLETITATKAGTVRLSVKLASAQ